MNAVELRQLAIVTLIAIPVIIEFIPFRRIAAAEKVQVASEDDKAKALERRRVNAELNRKIADLLPPQRKRLRHFQTELKRRCGKEANDPETWFVLECTDQIIYRNVGAFSERSGMFTKRSVVAEVQRREYTHHTIVVSGLNAAAFALVKFDSSPPTEALDKLNKWNAQKFRLEPTKTFQVSTFQSEEKARAYGKQVDERNLPEVKD